MLINVIDNLAPFTIFVGHEAKETKPPKPIKNAINVRHRPVKIFRKNPSIALKARIVSIDKEIKSFYKSAQTKKVKVMIDSLKGCLLSVLSTWLALLLDFFH